MARISLSAFFRSITIPRKAISGSKFSVQTKTASQFTGNGYHQSDDTGSATSRAYCIKNGQLQGCYADANRLVTSFGTTGLASFPAKAFRTVTHGFCGNLFVLSDFVRWQL